MKVRNSWGPQSLWSPHTYVDLISRNLTIFCGEKPRKIPCWLWQVEGKISFVKYAWSLPRDQGLLSRAKYLPGPYPTWKKAFIQLQSPVTFLSCLREVGSSTSRNACEGPEWDRGTCSLKDRFSWKIGKHPPSPYLTTTPTGLQYNSSGLQRKEQHDTDSL